MTTYLGASVGPWAAYVLQRDHRDVLDSMEARGQALLVAGQREVGSQLVNAVAQIRKAGHDRWAAHASEVGRSEVPTGPGAPRSPRVLRSGLTTREAAAQLKVCERQVINLIKAGTLAAALVGGRWEIDEVSVAAELKRRRGDAA